MGAERGAIGGVKSGAWGEIRATMYNNDWRPFWSAATRRRFPFAPRVFNL